MQPAPSDIITALGGPTLLSETINALPSVADNPRMHVTPQAISHWKKRGIPRRKMIAHKALFDKGLRLAKKNISPR